MHCLAQVTLKFGEDSIAVAKDLKVQSHSPALPVACHQALLCQLSCSPGTSMRLVMPGRKRFAHCTAVLCHIHSAAGFGSTCATFSKCPNLKRPGTNPAGFWSPQSRGWRHQAAALLAEGLLPLNDNKPTGSGLNCRSPSPRSQCCQAPSGRPSG